MTTPDQQLVNDIKNSKVAAFEKLYYSYYQPLFYFSWSRTNCAETAKEIVQEIFMRLWDKRDRLDSNKSIKAYLYRIANNIIVDYLRKQKVRSKFLDSEKEKLDTTSTEPMEFNTRFNIAIQKLPEKYRTVFILSRVEEYTYDEIANMCEISKKTVENRLKKAIEILRKYLS